MTNPSDPKYTDNDTSHTTTHNAPWLVNILLNSTSDPLLITDAKHTIILLNHAAEALFQLNAQDVSGHNIQTVFAEMPELLAMLMEDKAVAEDAEWESASGRIFSPRLTHTVGEADQHSTTLVLRDITPFKQLNKDQSEFIRIISHDLRTPLTYMQGFANLLTMTAELDEAQTGYVDMILGGIDQLTALVDNFHDAGRWDPQIGYELSREVTDLAQVSLDTVAKHQQVADEHDIVLTADLPPDIPILNIDTQMFERALTNLVSNAIKYSPNGGKVNVALENNGDNVVICVSDTGLGVAEENYDKLFERGSRVVTKAVKEARIKGSGLGLFIVRSVAQLHGGTAWVESEVGEGSHFYMSIPLSGANLIGR